MDWSVINPANCANGWYLNKSGSEAWSLTQNSHGNIYLPFGGNNEHSAETWETDEIESLLTATRNQVPGKNWIGPVNIQRSLKTWRKIVHSLSNEYFGPRKQENGE